MAKREHRVTFRFEEDVILYHLNYEPPVPNCAGESGFLFSEEDFFDVPYEQVVRLGEGEHVMTFDETVRKFRNRPGIFEGDNGLFLLFRYEQFLESVGIATLEQLFCRVVLSFTPDNAERIMMRLSQKTLEELRRYARDIPPSEEDLPSERFAVFYSSGLKTIPQANLQAIRKACEEMEGHE